MSHTDFFYSEALGLYISQTPLCVSSRVLQAADRAGVELSWNEQGMVHRIPFHDVKKLLFELDAKMLSAKEYTLVVSEQKAKGQDKILSSLQTCEFTEWLDTAFRTDGENIYVKNHPTEAETNDENYSNWGNLNMPFGRPGWFSFESELFCDIGIPQNVNTCKNSIGSNRDNLWKYWSVNNQGYAVGAMRGYVLSSGTCSLDFDIPLFAQHPMIMIRECRESLDGLRSPNDYTADLYRLIKGYENTLVTKPMAVKTSEIDHFYQDFASKQAVIDGYRKYGAVADEFERHALEESSLDILGKAEAFRRFNSREFKPPSSYHEVNWEYMADYLTASRDKLRDKLNKKEKIVFAVGHKNPDADAIVSALFEAIRRSIVYDDLCLPLVDGIIPCEVHELLGRDISEQLITSDEELFKEAESSGLVRWVLTDWHEFPHEQFVEAVIDHHIFEKEFPYYVAVSKELNWASTLQVYAKMLGNQMRLDKPMAKILLGGTLLEAEYDLMLKVMGHMDKMLYDSLMSEAECQDDQQLYIDLVRPLLEENDPETLFTRDYKQSHGMMGFAVAKVSGFYSDAGECLKANLRKEVLDMAKANNLKSNLPLTVLKFVDYLEDGCSVSGEEIACVFNENWYDDGFQNAIMDLVEQAYQIYHKERSGAVIQRDGNTIKVSSADVQIPRLLLAPLMRPLVNEHTKFFYSEKLGKFVARGFYDGDKDQYQHAYTSDVFCQPCNQISYYDMKELVTGSANVTVMSMPEYWDVFAEAQECNDYNMLNSLRDGGFVELLDTYIFKIQHLIHHPDAEQLQNIANHAKERVTFLDAHPGLIRPLEIDEHGLPAKVHSPDNYGDPSLWRYWAPDVDHCVACRGHIFALKQTAIDLKILPHEKHENMGFRPVYTEIPEICSKINETEKWLNLKVLPRTFGVY